MIRARMSFAGFTKLYRKDTDGKAILIDPDRHTYGFEEMLAALDDGTFRSVTVNWQAVCTSDPISSNAKWAFCTPSGKVDLVVANPHAVREIIEMCEVARRDGRKNQGKYDTTEFYVDLYPGAAED